MTKLDDADRVPGRPAATPCPKALFKGGDLTVASFFFCLFAPTLPLRLIQPSLSPEVNPPGGDPVVSPHPHPKRVPVREAVFLGFIVCRHPSRLPAIRGRAAALGYSSRASLPRSSRWGATGKSHLPDVGDFSLVSALSFVSFVDKNSPASLPQFLRPQGAPPTRHSSLRPQGAPPCPVCLFPIFHFPFTPSSRAELSARHLEKVVPSCLGCLPKRIAPLPPCLRGRGHGGMVGGMIRRQQTAAPMDSLPATPRPCPRP